MQFAGRNYANISSQVITREGEGRRGMRAQGQRVGYTDYRQTDRSNHDSQRVIRRDREPVLQALPVSKPSSGHLF